MARRPSDGPVRALLDRIREDALVTRRDYLRILVTVSGGLLVGTASIAAGVYRRHVVARGPARRIAASLRRGESVYFNYPRADDQAIAVRLEDGSLAGYSAVCTHLACSVLWRRETGTLDCPCHEGSFDAATGRVLAGPPPRPLPKVLVEERDGAIWAVGTER